MKKTYYNLLILPLCIVAGMLLGYYGNDWTREQSNAKEIRFETGKFTNPLLECELGRETIGSRKFDFSPQLNAYIKEIKSKKGISDISVYFRDMNNGPIAGVNQSSPFLPASLLKVPVMISYLSWAEEDSTVLDKEIPFTTLHSSNYVPEFPPPVSLEVGKSYSVRNLMERMIQYSDNESFFLLVRNLPKKYQKDFYALLGIDPELLNDTRATLTVSQYSIFFRVLFNSSFLSRTNSEYALELLTKTSFVEGLRAGVPATIPVAHKFGERKLENNQQQFHDCGIVYYPAHPYLLCVMTRGDNVQDLVKSIADVSDFVYRVIEKQYK